MRTRTEDDTSFVYFTLQEFEALPEPLANLIKAVCITVSQVAGQLTFLFEPFHWSAVADVIYHWHRPQDLTPSRN